MEVKVVWYPVKGFEAAKKFYGEVLGMKQTFAMSRNGVSIGFAYPISTARVKSLRGAARQGAA
ncbi:MAG TPA: hypothetical protein VN862_07785 [Candidatus Acidoferrales bacterium]|nr:hypothetical protein [Candidatus Acidoferrales bacterium]